VEEGTGGTAKEYPPQSEIAERSAQVRRRWQWYVERERQQMEFATLKDGRIYVNGEELISEQLLNMHQSTRRARVEDMAATLNRAAREWGRRDVPMEHNDEFRG
jgi:hypothetical protein